MASKLAITLAGGAAALACNSIALGAAEGVTHKAVIVEEFTAEWCGPCYGGWFAMERMEARWGDAVSLLTWSIADRYTNSDGTRRQNEVGVTAIPSFLFQGLYFSVGTPSDGTIDSYISASQNIAASGRIIGRWKLKPNRVVRVGVKFQADQALSNCELRINVHESNWYVYCSNGLTHYNHHVQQVFYEALPTMQAGEQFTLTKDYDLSGNTWIHDPEQLGVTVFVHDRASGRSVKAGWELGAVNLGDLNGDLSITRSDGVLFQQQMGKRAGQQGFNPAADWDSNGIINIADRQMFLDYVNGGGMR